VPTRHKRWLRFGLLTSIAVPIRRSPPPTGYLWELISLRAVVPAGAWPADRGKTLEQCPRRRRRRNGCL
jgi:hypothetical protein